MGHHAEGTNDIVKPIWVCNIEKIRHYLIEGQKEVNSKLLPDSRTLIFTIHAGVKAEDGSGEKQGLWGILRSY